MNEPVRILVVDDEAPFAVNLCRILERRGYAAAAAFNGPAALEKITGPDAFHVVILDVKMPGMDGIAVLRAIKKTAPRIEVIMLTGHATLENGIQAMREGAFDYLMKPCDVEDLCAKVNTAYAVETIRRRPVLWMRSVVKEIENPFFVRLEENDPAKKALSVMERKSGALVKDTLFVTDAENRIKGVITRRELISAVRKMRRGGRLSREVPADDAAVLAGVSVGEIMQCRVPDAAGPDEALPDVGRRMLARHVRCMPVVSEGRMTGIIRLQDILRYMESGSI